MVDDRSYSLWKIGTNTAQNTVDVGMRIRKNGAGNGFVISIEDMLKSVGIGAMANIVQQCGTQNNGALPIIPKAVSRRFARVIRDKIVAHFTGNFINP